jgi:hypothetical protein
LKKKKKINHFSSNVCKYEVKVLSLSLRPLSCGGSLLATLKQFFAGQIRSSRNFGFGFGFGMLCLSVSVSVSVLVQTKPKFWYFGFGSNYGFGRSLLLMQHENNAEANNHFKSFKKNLLTQQFFWLFVHAMIRK